MYSGHFGQILPVVRRGSRAQTVNPCPKSSTLFSLFRLLRLAENMRLLPLRASVSAIAAALAYSEYLLRLDERNVAASGDLDMIPLLTFAHISASSLSACVQVFECIQACYADED